MRENDSGLSVTSARTEAQTEAGARAERPTERDTQRGRERGRGCGRERLSSYTHTVATREKLKPSEPHVHTHTRADHYGMAEPTRTHATSAPTAHAAAGNPGQPPVDRDERCSVCGGTGTAVTSTFPPLEGARKTDMDRSALPLQLPTEIHILEVDQLYTLETPWLSQRDIAPRCSPAHVCVSLVAAISHICLPLPLPHIIPFSLVFKLPLPVKPRAPPHPKNWVDDEGRRHGSEQVCYLRQLVAYRRALYSVYSTGGG